LNRGLVRIGFSVKKHPEAGPFVLTVAAGVVGVLGGGIGFFAAADRRKRDKAAEVIAAALGSVVVVYVIVVVGAAFGAFKHVHFNAVRLATVGVGIAVGVGASFAKAFVSALVGWGQSGDDAA
jgi:uncharacterized membrane protein YeaQ/YmgE (transglycosylase-associated protein family)